MNIKGDTRFFTTLWDAHKGHSLSFPLSLSNAILKYTYDIVPDLERAYSTTEKIIFYLHVMNRRPLRALYVCLIFKLRTTEIQRRAR